MIRAGAPLLALLAPAAVIVVAGAATPITEFFTNQGDVRLYLEKAGAFASGLVPYRDFPLEYPPVALVPMTVPYLASRPFGEVSLDVYRWLFVGWEAVLMLALAFLIVRTARLGGVAAGGPGGGVGAGNHSLERPALGAAIRLLPLAVGAALALAWRFDLFPALLVMVALWAALKGRSGLAGFAIALGILAKLYPLAVVPVLAVPWLMPVDLRRLVRYGLALVVTVAVVMLPLVLLAGSNAFGFLTYQAERGLQVESIGGGLAVLGGLLAGQPVAINHLYSSVQVEGAFADAWLAGLPLLTLAGFGVLGLLGWRRARREVALDGAVSASAVVTIALAAILVLIATNKVFSIQYVVWIVPFAALLRGGRFWLALGVVALTMPIHPLLYEGLVGQQALSVLVLNLRNALFIVLLAWTLWDIGRENPGELARPAGLEPTTFRSAT